MITEVLSLGIKGADLVVSALKKIQQQKEKFKKPEKVSVSPITTGQTGYTQPGQPAPAPTPQPGNKEEQGKEKEEKEGKKYNWDNAKSDIKTGINAVGGMDTKALITGLGHSLDVWTVGVSGILAEMGGAAITFKDKIKQSSQLVADTASSYNTVNKFAQTEDARDFMKKEYTKNRKGESVLSSGRNDISVSEKSGIAEAIGNTMGKFTPEFRRAVEKLYGSNAKGQTAYDVKETTALAQGNFAATGTDTGFFLQKISDSFSGLPPSIRQALQGQLFEMVPDKDRSKQMDADERATNVRFDNAERNKAEQIATPGNVSAAHRIDEIQKDIEIGIAQTIDSLGTNLTKLNTIIKDKTKEMGNISAADATKKKAWF